MAVAQAPSSPVQIKTEGPSSPVDDATSINSTPKVTHARDDDESHGLSPANKKRRTGSASETASPSAEQAPVLSSEPRPDQNAPAQSAPPSQLPEPKAHPADQSGQPSATDASNKSSFNGDVSAPPPTQAPSESNVLETISFIMDQPGSIENQSSLNKRLQEASKSASINAVKSNPDWKTESLPILDNLATQILSLLARSSYKDITSIVSEPNSENGHAYSSMRSLFDHAKKVYSTNGPFLSATQLGFTKPGQIDIIRKANMASFVSSIFGTQGIGFSELHDHFLEIFVPEGSRLLKGQGALFLELKTQAFIASMNNSEQGRREILRNLFPDDLGLKLLARRPGNKQLAPSETDFVKRAWSRRDILLAEIDNPESVRTLPERYRWEDFLRDLSSYVSKHYDSTTTQCKKASKGPSVESGDAPSQAANPPPEPRNMPLETQFSITPNPPEAPIDRSAGRVDLVARAARAAQIALQGQGFRHTPRPVSNPNPQAPQQPQQPQQPFNPPPPHVQHQPATAAQPTFHYTTASPTPPPPPQPTQVTFHQNQFHFQQYNPQAASASSRANAAANYGYMPGIPHYSQSQPTQILYERARMATTAKSSPTSRRAGLPSQRRPWTTEEENALMAGLDRVKGPHWSQILAMFGPGGTINEALKDRNQVQLKDKARNLKLFFLKSGIEVPYYLKFVTGELKTRAPAQAAKQEARERERRRGEEDKAHVEGLEGMMALAGAHPPHNQGEAAATPMNIATPPAYPQTQGQQQATLDQTTEQALIQRLTQETKAESLQPPPQQGPVDPSLQHRV
ncbi:TTAGGG repeat binding factor [Coccidioides posadasii str. Silveira]|uniref:MYB DNA binding protein n=1 Tax=Coccidioides posadasii (strain RMSCC 757 / Silveira) TaxID=443226 RepID=E9D299_COCPS|nr:MYB DNA binding protein [Coccidioides posadasii str. Silveira]QVM12935.1 TTAGGG repeat binding factor [Coccidioides posadasii str. Silveira]